MDRKHHDDEGRIMILTLGYFLVCAVLITGIATISAIYLERKSLLLVADAAAHYSANQLDINQYYAGGNEGVDRMKLTKEDIDRSLSNFIAQAPSGYLNFEQFSLTGKILESEGRGAEILATATIQPSFLGWFLEPLNAGFTIEVTSSALPVSAEP